MGGGPVIGEKQARDAACLVHGIPNFNDKATAEQFASGSTVVVGSGASAATSLHGLADLASRNDGMEVTWIANKPEPYRRIPDDPLPQRDGLYNFAQQLFNGQSKFKGIKTLVGQITRLDRTHDGLMVTTTHPDGSVTTISTQRVLAHTGFRPDTSITEELQVLKPRQPLL